MKVDGLAAVVGRQHPDAVRVRDPGDRISGNAVDPGSTEVDGSGAADFRSPDAPADAVAGLQNDNVIRTGGTKLCGGCEAGDARANDRHASGAGRRHGGYSPGADQSATGEHCLPEAQSGGANPAGNEYSSTQARGGATGCRPARR